MEETGLENMTENTEKEKVLSKEAIVAALNERLFQFCYLID